jgi:peptidoglycan LD-endopeptidase CwlK
METTSLARLHLLHPKVRDSGIIAYQEAVRKTPVGVHPCITETLRSFQRSDELYAQGRTKPGAIVSNSKGGQSYHNYGLAIDFVLEIDGKQSWKVDENWMKVVEIFKAHGWDWGGDFKSIKDYPHFEMRLGYNWRDLLIMHNNRKVDKDGYVII